MKYFIKILIGSILSIIIVSESFAEWNPSSGEKRLLEYCKENEIGMDVQCITFVYLLSKHVLSQKELEEYADNIDKEYALLKEFKEKGLLNTFEYMQKIQEHTNNQIYTLSEDKTAKFTEASTHTKYEFSIVNYIRMQNTKSDLRHYTISMVDCDNSGFCFDKQGHPITGLLSQKEDNICRHPSCWKISTYENGKKNGKEFVIFGLAREIMYEADFIDGKKEGVEKRYSARGVVDAETYYENGQVIKSESK